MTAMEALVIVEQGLMAMNWVVMVPEDKKKELKAAVQVLFNHIKMLEGKVDEPK